MLEHFISVSCSYIKIDAARDGRLDPQVDPDAASVLSVVVGPRNLLSPGLHDLSFSSNGYRQLRRTVERSATVS